MTKILVPNLYHRCTVVKVIDGDTVDFNVDLGFHIYRTMRFRLYGIDAPEMKGESYQLGTLAKFHLIKLLDERPKWTISTFKDETDKYGRYLCEILLGDTYEPEAPSINKLMVEQGFAIARVW